MTGRPPPGGTLHRPHVAVDTLAGRLRALDVADPVPGVDVTWHGRADLPADRTGSEATVQARCGLMEVNGRDAGTPRRLALDVASVAAGIVAAQGVLAAAIGGQASVQTSVLEAGLLLLSHYFVVATGLGDAIGEPALPDPGPPFRSADGRWFEIETLDPEVWKAFWTRLGAGATDLGRGWTFFRWRYERAACSLPTGLHGATAGRRLDELAAIAGAAGVSLVPVREAAGGAGAGAATRRDLPAGAPPGRSPARPGAPLAGIRVVESTNRIQGPFAGMLLRMLGADVVRVQPPEGDYGRAAATLHRGKSSVRLDLRTPAARAELVELVAGADVFLHNWRPGRAAEWRLDVETLSRARPGLVYASASGWGDRPDAPAVLGTDFLVQAATGLGAALHPADEPPFPSRIILCDLFGALVTAEGILAALHRRQRTGAGYDVGSSLAAGATALLASAGRSRPAWGPLDRPVPTADGLLMVGASDGNAVDPARLRDRPAAEWEEVLTADGIPAAVVCDDLATVPADPRFAGLFEPAGPGLAPRPPWTFA